MPVGRYKLNFNAGWHQLTCFTGTIGFYSDSWLTPLTSSGDISIIEPPCQLKNTEIQVPMGSASLNSFNGPGSIANPRLFNIPLACSENVNLYIKVSPSANGSPNPDKGLLNLNEPTGSSTAKGVALQLLYKGVPLKLNQSTPVGVAQSSSFDIPLQAQYIQAGNEVTAGNANASATFVISYN